MPSAIASVKGYGETRNKFPHKQRPSNAMQGPSTVASHYPLARLETHSLKAITGFPLRFLGLWVDSITAYARKRLGSPAGVPMDA